MANVVIDFSNLEGPVFTGRPRGENLRSKFKLDDVDSKLGEVEIKIPDSTYSISSSFVLGLIGKSVLISGSKEAFYARYHFIANKIFQDVIDSCVTRVLQEKKLMP